MLAELAILGIAEDAAAAALAQSNSIAGMAALLSGAGSGELSEAARLVEADLKKATLPLDASVVSAGFSDACPDPWQAPRAVLLTGATGFLGT